MGVASSIPVMNYIPLSRSAVFDENTDYYLK